MKESDLIFDNNKEVKNMKIAMIQHNPTVGDFDLNARKIRDGIMKAVVQKPDIIVLPELALWGYPPLDQLTVPEMVARHNAAIEEIRAFSGNIPIVIGATRKNEGPGMPLFNSALILENGKVIGWKDKELLPRYDVFDEPRYFESGEGDGETFSIKCSGSFFYQKIAIEVCEDIWNGSEIPTERHLYPNDPLQKFEGKSGDNKIDVLIIPNGSPYYWGKGNVRFELVSGIAKRLGCVVVYVNQVGGNDELVFDGRSFAVNAEGKCIAAAKAFEEDVVVFDTDGPEVPYLFDKDDISQLYDSLVLSVRDYARKNNFDSALLGLSGGIDSALVAAIAADALGSKNVEVVMMPSRYTEDMSNEDAQKQAETLGVRFTFIPIEEPVVAFHNVLSARFPDSTPDVADENLQARARGNILMFISNRTGKLLLTTGNKSEMSVGYATLYGDMAGGFAPIKDVDKLLVYQLAKYRNSISPVIPERVLTRPPSAELAPGQQDQDSLPPYEILVPILEHHIERNMSAHEISQETGYDLVVVEEVLRKVERSEYKRRQSPPGTKVTAKAFGVGRRFPIAAKGVSK